MKFVSKEKQTKLEYVRKDSTTLAKRVANH